MIVPRKLEYSPKDDKFRIISASPGGHARSINMARIRSVELLERCPERDLTPAQFRMMTVVLELTDERNALERSMLHFSNLEKETVKLDGKHYRITLHYEQEDETEILIRVLSFGPVLKVVEPESFARLVRERLARQMNLTEK